MDFNNQENEKLNIKDILNDYLKFWYWFIISAAIALFCAFYYLRYTPKQYSSTAKILINSQKSSAAELAGVMDLNKINSEADGQITDQIEIIKSRRIIEKVVKKNNYNISYYSVGDVMKSELAPNSSPITFQNISLKKNFSAPIIIKSAKTFIIEGDETVYKFNQNINKGSGNFIVKLNKFSPQLVDKSIHVNVSTIEQAVNKYIGKVNAAPKGNDSRIINFSMTGTVPEISNMFMDDLIEVYNTDIVQDNLKLTTSTTKFINKKLEEVTNKLKKFDSRLKDFKSGNKFTDLDSEAQIFLQDASSNDKLLFNTNTELTLVESMRSSLRTNRTDLLPTNIGLKDGTISNQINNYNQLVLEKQEILKTSTENHPNVINIQNQLSGIKQNLNQSLNIYRNSLQTQINEIRSKQNEVENKITMFPSQEKELKDITREQKIVEALFLFLLQKKEENEIKAAASPDFIKVIDYSYSPKAVVSPNRNFILLGSLVAGLALPFVIIFIYNLMNNKVRSKDDLIRIIDAPVIGQIPHSYTEIVKENDFSTISESLRILRTNIDHNLKNIEGAKCIYITSTISGEGKTFLSSNLTKIISETNKKVLLIGTDLRNPKLTKSLNLTRNRKQLGLTEFLYNDEVEPKDIISKKPDGYKFDVINSGKLSPNPTELLMNNRFGDLIQYAREKYDYIIVDTVPVGVVTDTFLIAEHADMTLFVVRAHATDIEILEVAKDLYRNNRLNNMTFTINDVNLDYRYGLGYYTDLKLPWYIKLIQKFKKS